MIHRTFDRRSKKLDAEISAFQAEVQELEKKVAPAVLVTRTKREGHLLHVTVLAALRASSVQPASQNFVEAWTPY